MRLATWNVNSLNARLERVEAWLTECQPDVVCLQETKLADSAFPAMAFASLGYEAVHHGEGRWNGVAILSRVGIDDVVSGFADGDAPDAEARLLTATCGGVRVMSAYVPNGRAHRPRALPLQAGVARAPPSPPRGGSRSRAARGAQRRLQHRAHGPRRVGPGGRARRHAREPARARAPCRRVLDWGLVDVFRAPLPRRRAPLLVVGLPRRQLPQGLSACASTSCSPPPPLADRIEWALIDRNARKGKAPSDHAPVVVQVGEAA